MLAHWHMHARPRRYYSAQPKGALRSTDLRHVLCVAYSLTSEVLEDTVSVDRLARRADEDDMVGAADWKAAAGDRQACALATMLQSAQHQAMKQRRPGEPGPAIMQGAGGAWRARGQA